MAGASQSGRHAPGGAGIQAAQFVTGQKAEAVISGDFGPHAFEALHAAGVPMYLFGDCRTVREVMVQFKAGQLQQAGAATREDCHHEGKGIRGIAVASGKGGTGKTTVATGLAL